MNEIPETNTEPQGFTVLRGVPDDPRAADLVGMIQAEAFLRGQRLERLELAHKADGQGFPHVFYAVADLPAELRFGGVADFLEAFRRETSVEPWEECEDDHPRSARRSLERLLARLSRANELDAFNARDSLEAGGRPGFPEEPLPCRVRVLSASSAEPPLANAIADVEQLAVRLESWLGLVLVEPEDAREIDEHAAYWALVSSDVSHFIRDTDEAMEWLSGMIRARTSLLPTDAMTLRALASVREQAERRLAEIGG